MRLASLTLLALLGCNSVLGLETRPRRGDGPGGATTSGMSVGGGGGTGGGGTGASGGASSSSGGAGGSGSDTVGNCVLDPGEACEDCNDISGDGCDALGQVELGWVCPNVGLSCWRLSGLVALTGNVLVEAGGNGGSAFDDACPAGQLLVGVEAHNTTESGSPALGQLRGRCAPITLDVVDYDTGTVAFQTTPRGEEPITSLGAIDCPAGTVVTGLQARSGSIIRGYKLLCGALSFDGENIVTSNDTETGVIGTGPIDLAAARCPTGTAASAFTGRSGALIDRLTVRCDDIVPTYCGNFQQDLPFEACDDGNVLDGDGCDSRCQTE